MEEPLCGIEFLNQLREKGKKKKPSFRDLSRLFEQKAREKGIPIGGTFELTPLCNLDCKMCYVHLAGNQYNQADALSCSTWKKLIDASRIMVLNNDKNNSTSFDELDKLQDDTLNKILDFFGNLPTNTYNENDFKKFCEDNTIKLDINH